MKKQILSILLSLSMVVMLFPVTTFAEEETPEKITKIDMIVDYPIVGNKNENSGMYTGPFSLTSSSWYQISKDTYTGESDDVWEDVSQTTTYEEGYYYKVVLTFN